MKGRLGELLESTDVLYTIVCRDATLTDIELFAQAGYHIIWLDLEHSAMSTTEALRLGRVITHLGMVPLARILELSRTHVQRLLDGGFQVVALPDIRSVEQARQLVQLGKYPPIGRRGASSNSAGTGFTLGSDPAHTLRQANLATHLMTMFESDEGFEQLDAFVEIDGIDLFAVGPSDWSIGLGLFGEAALSYLTPKIERIVRAVHQAGKTMVMAPTSPEQARHYYDLGARIFNVGGDVTLKRRALFDTIGPFKDTFPE